MRKRHTPAFKARIVAEALKEQKTLAQIASENGRHPNQISAWKALALSSLPSVFERESKCQAAQTAHDKQLEDLYAQIGRLTTQGAWLKKKSGLELP